MKHEIASEADIDRLETTWSSTRSEGSALKRFSRLVSIADIPSIRTFAAQTIEFVVEGLIAAGTVTLIAGDSGCGKSTLATALGSAVERGVPFAGLATQKHPVLILDRENPLPIVVERFDRLRIDDSENFKVCGGWDSHEVPEPGSPVVARYVEISDPKPLIIVDSFIGFNPGDENDATQTRAYMQLFRELADRGATVIVLHHSGKSESTKEFRGSSDIKASIDVGWHLANLGDPSRLTSLRLKAFKARFTVRPELILFFTDNGFQMDSRPIEKSDEDLLQELLVARPGVGSKEFEDLAFQKKGITRGKARRFLKTGEKTGNVRIETGSKNRQDHVWEGPKKMADCSPDGMLGRADFSSPIGTQKNPRSPVRRLLLAEPAS